ncbi:hypothetical protein F5Y19DRAFT_487249 [Xylariaceae sp. FL1651]|nr:hypothetical protein F5Y19DRAFT_487249 [Xylariaceae sp. FL1651]
MDNAFSGADTQQFPYPVYTGVWINWSHNRAVGATLTLTQSSANLLVAFVALFAALVAGHIWKIICFSVHSYYSTSNARNAVHHQRQVLLRNNSGAASSAVNIMKMLWAWRRLGIAWPLLPLFACAVVLAILLALASGFSSRVATGNEVLILGKNCGMSINPLGDNLTMTLTTYLPLIADYATSAAIQATQCYENTTASTSACSMFVKPRLPLSVNRNASCPFGNLCRNARGNLLLDTGLLDSHEDFGLNAPKSERFSMREVAQCAPLRTDGHQDQWNLTQDRSYTRYYYGRSRFNYTCMASNDGIYEAKVARLAEGDEYGIVTKQAAFKNGTLTKFSSFDPIPELVASRGRLSLFFLSAKGILFAKRTPDPWYHATRKVATVDALSLNSSMPRSKIPVYGQDRAGAPLACSSKMQICMPGLPAAGRCTALGNPDDIFTQVLSELASDAASTRLKWAIAALESVSNGISDLVKAMGAQSLLSRRSLVSGVQSPLPDNQWQLDVEHWHKTHLASHQIVLAQVAAGLPPSYPEEWIKRPQNKVEIKMCNSQKAISPAHSSFSVLGLLLILILGFLVITASIFIETIAKFIQTQARLNPYSRLEWISNGTLQLQRLAHEELGIGDWTHGDRAVPITNSVITLAPLDLTNLKHPRLQMLVNSKRISQSEMSVLSS